MTKPRERSVSISAADGHRIPSLHTSSGSRSLVILSHGITTGKEEDGIYTKFAREILSPSFDTLRFDYRGHGDSKMRSVDVTVSGEMLDLMAVMRWSETQGYTHVFHVATSFGASVFLLAAGHFPLRKVDGVVFWNPVVSFRNTFIEAKVGWGREFFDQESITELAHRSATRIPETDFDLGPEMTIELICFAPETTRWPNSLPLLVIHGDEDSTVPFEDARAYCAANPGTKFVPLSGVDHGFDQKIDEAFEVTLRWLSEAVKEK